MEKPKKRHVPRSASAPRPGEIARAKGQALSSYRVGALPIINRLLERMRLQEFLRSYLPLADRRCRIAPAIGVILLLKNVLLCREPLYGIGEWAARYAPEALGFAGTQLPSLNDDRVGRCLDRLFQSDITSMVSDLLICGILMWSRFWRFGLTGDRVNESQIGARIGELGRVEVFQQMSDCAVGQRVRHRMDMDT